MSTRQKRFWRKVSVTILGFTLAFTCMAYAAGEAVVINNWLPNWPKEVETWRVLSRDLVKSWAFRWN